MLALFSLPTPIKIIFGLILVGIGGYILLTSAAASGWLLLIAGAWAVIGSFLGLTGKHTDHN